MHMPQTQQQTSIWNIFQRLQARQWLSIVAIAVAVMFITAVVMSMERSKHSLSAELEPIAPISTEDTIARASATTQLPTVLMVDPATSSSHTTVSSESTDDGRIVRSSGSVTVNGVTTPLPTTVTPSDSKHDSQTSNTSIEIRLDSSSDTNSTTSVNSYTSSNTSTVLDNTFWSQ